MWIRLRYGWQKWTLVLLVVAGGALYVRAAAHMLLAARYARSTDSAGLLSAAELEPLDATNTYRLARYAFTQEMDPRKAVILYQRTVALDPHTSHYWLDLAVAQNASGDAAGMRTSVERAVTVDRKTPETLWRAANLFILAGDNQRGFAVLHDLIGPRPEYAADAIDLAWRASRNADMVLAQVVPPLPAAQFAFLAKMQEQKRPEDADRAWRAVLAGRQPFVASDAFPYIEYLLQQNEGVKSRQAWNDAAKVDATLAPYAGDSLVSNGGFELPVISRALGWRHQAVTGVSLEVSAAEVHSGQHALVITFDSAVADPGIEQWVPLAPNGLYAVKTSYKAELEGESAPRLTVMTPKGERLMMSEEMRSRKDWEEMRGVFATGPEQSVVILRLIRDPAAPHLVGRVLLDDVSITREK
ncbi:MAG: hypothetical protein HYX28_00955 [Candidatus Koribacter versatilis]|uniref:Tetratricopeptide repeat protein n=1 Tax=Candidatus Korobacter versatilis TaxID=658062 RepID=A0A932A615_9BACT|nr:hypothetical protein [Candidatus Koribacter versatilis]